MQGVKPPPYPSPPSHPSLLPNSPWYLHKVLHFHPTVLFVLVHIFLKCEKDIHDALFYRHRLINERTSYLPCW